MPPANNNTQPQSNPFEIVTPGKSKKGSAKGIIIALVVVLFLALGIFGGVLLVRQNQNVQEKAACLEQCPGNDGVLRNCTPPESDGSSADSACSFMRIESCGGAQYCCPGAGSQWTTSLAGCAALSATATATATATSTATATATATATSTSTSSSTGTATSTPAKTSTAKATSTSAATKAPIPQTGTGWPTYAGIGLGILVIVGSLLLAI